MIEGCVNVEAEEGITKDAKQLARFVHKDCELVLIALKNAETNDD